MEQGENLFRSFLGMCTKVVQPNTLGLRVRGGGIWFFVVKISRGVLKFNICV